MLSGPPDSTTWVVTIKVQGIQTFACLREKPVSVRCFIVHIAGSATKPAGEKMRATWMESGTLIVLGIIAIWDGVGIAGQTSKYKLAELSGGYEAMLGALLVIASVTYVTRERTRMPSIAPDQRLSGGLLRVFTALTILAAYLLIMPLLGYMLSTAFVLVAYIRFFSSYRWTSIIAYSCLFAVGTTYVWVLAQLTMPQGVIPWP